jgi:Uma2 family endonuclease
MGTTRHDKRSTPMSTVISPAEERIILRDVSWQTYQQLLANYADNSAPRFTYDRGVLEIMSPSEPHERPNRLIALMVEIIAEELNIDVMDLGSTTFDREDLQRGFEPDSCFYIQNEPRIRGKEEIDLTVDPPPDLVIEIDITNSSLNKLPIFAQLGVPEVWRYDGNRVIIFHLIEDDYSERDHSIAFPFLTSSVIANFVQRGRAERRTVWLRALRTWVRENR